MESSGLRGEVGAESPNSAPKRDAVIPSVHSRRICFDSLFLQFDVLSFSSRTEAQGQKQALPNGAKFVNTILVKRFLHCSFDF